MQDSSGKSCLSSVRHIQHVSQFSTPNTLSSHISLSGSRFVAYQVLLHPLSFVLFCLQHKENTSYFEGSFLFWQLNDSVLRIVWVYKHCFLFKDYTSHLRLWLLEWKILQVTAVFGLQLKNLWSLPKLVISASKLTFI